MLVFARSDWCPTKLKSFCLVLRADADRLGAMCLPTAFLGPLAYFSSPFGWRDKRLQRLLEYEAYAASNLGAGHWRKTVIRLFSLTDGTSVDSA